MQILARAACLAPGEPIPHQLLLRTLDLPENDLEAILQAEDALTRLMELGLLQPETDQAVRLHRLVVAFIREVAGSLVEPTQTAVEITLGQAGAYVFESP